MPVVFLTSASSSPYNKPVDWTDAGATVELVGTGGRSGAYASGTSSTSGGGGGGGAYGKLTYSSGALNSTCAFKIIASNTTVSQTTSATCWGNTAYTTAWYSGPGQPGATTTAGAGGLAMTSNGTPGGGITWTSSGAVAGGAGGAGRATAYYGGGGGGGAGGPAALGGAGGGGGSGSGYGGGGGGAGNNGATGVGVTPTGASGGNGGPGVGPSHGGGAGSTSAASPNGSDGIGGQGGGGGCGGGAVAYGYLGGPNGNVSDWVQTSNSATAGAGGGGGGGGGYATNSSTNSPGKNGGNYGGGGGGPGATRSSSGTHTQGAGASGLIVITYTGVNVLTGNEAAAGLPVIGQPVMAVIVAMPAATTAVAGIPVVDSTALGKVLAATAAAAGVPVFGTPVLAEIVPPADLTATALTTAAPVLGAPTSLQVHSLGSLEIPAPSVDIDFTTSAHRLVSPDNMTSNSAPSPYVASASGIYDSSYDAFYAFDLNPLSFWSSNTVAGPWWIQVDLGAGALVASYSLTARPIEQGGSFHYWSRWELRGSNNGSDWTTVDSRSIFGAWTDGETKYFPVTTPSTYRYWRFHITSTQDDAAAEIATIRLYDNVAASLVNSNLSCSRASGGYAQTADGHLVWFEPNKLRITDRGLLIEDARTNTLLYSTTPGAGGNWTPQYLDVTQIAAVAPDGTTTAALCTDQAVTANCILQNTTDRAANVKGTLSVYAKKGTRSHIWLQFGETSANWIAAAFDLDAGTVGDSSSAGGGTLSGANIEALADGWYRVSLTGSISTSGGGGWVTIGVCSTSVGVTFGSSGYITYTGNGSGTFYIWGPQFEDGAFASSYIPTTSGSATRAADTVTTSGALASSLANPAMSLVADTIYPNLEYAVYGGFVSGSVTAYEGVSTYYDGDMVNIFDGNHVVASTYDGNVWATVGPGLSKIYGFKTAFGQNVSGRSLVAGGGAVVSDGYWTDFSSPSYLGHSTYAGGRWSNVTIRRLAVWDERLNDGALQELSSPKPYYVTYKPSLEIDFTSSDTSMLVELLTCSRASGAYATTTDGRLVWFDEDELRLIPGLGMLVEGAVENKLPNSRDLDSFVKRQASVTDGFLAPDGTMTAQKLVENNENNYHSFDHYIVSSGLNKWTASIYVKADERTAVTWGISDTSSGPSYMRVDLTDGSILGVLNEGAFTHPATYGVELLANGWYRLWLTVVQTTDYGSVRPELYLNNYATYQGDGSSGVYVWGAQCEMHDLSSYFPTSGSAATRAADDIRVIGAAADLFLRNNASVVLDCKSLRPATGNFMEVLAAYYGGAFLVGSGDDRKATCQIDLGYLYGPYFGNGQSYMGGVKTALGWNLTGVTIAGGGTFNSGRGTYNNGLSDVRFTYGANDSEKFFGLVRGLQLWKQRLPDHTLQALTSGEDWWHVGSYIDFDFVNGRYGCDDDLTKSLVCSRASGGYGTTVAGELVWFDTDELRITDRGLLVEAARTNFFLHSGDGEYWTSWNENASHTTTSDITDPLGGTNANKIVSGSGIDNCVFKLSSGASNAPGKVWTFSFWARTLSGTATIPILIDDDVGNLAIDPNNVSVELTSTWQRFFFSGTAIAGSSTTVRAGFGGFSTWTTINTIYVWGAQVEEGSFASSYIPTTSGSATRAADGVTFTYDVNQIIAYNPMSVVVEIESASGERPVGHPSILGGWQNMLDVPDDPSKVRTTSTAASGSHELTLDMGDDDAFVNGVRVGLAGTEDDRSLTGAGLSVEDE